MIGKIYQKEKGLPQALFLLNLYIQISLQVLNFLTHQRLTYPAPIPKLHGQLRYPLAVVCFCPSAFCSKQQL